MNIESMLLGAIQRNEMKKFLLGEGEYMVEPSQYSPGVGVTDVGKVLARGIYKIYEYDTGIKGKFENVLLQMIDDSEYAMYMVCVYLMSQLLKEKSGISPFELSKELILKKLSLSICSKEKILEEGICYPSGLKNKSAMDDIRRWKKICKEEFNISF